MQRQVIITRVIYKLTVVGGLRTENKTSLYTIALTFEIFSFWLPNCQN